MTRLFTGNLLVLVSFSTLWVVTYSSPNQSINLRGYDGNDGNKVQWSGLFVPVKKPVESWRVWQKKRRTQAGRKVDELGEKEIQEAFMNKQTDEASQGLQRAV